MSRSRHVSGTAVLRALTDEARTLFVFDFIRRFGSRGRAAFNRWRRELSERRARFFAARNPSYTKRGPGRYHRLPRGPSRYHQVPRGLRARS